ncbi:MAG: hypothetical protein AAGF46_11615 [Pseudomonadota bacterium]
MSRSQTVERVQTKDGKRWQIGLAWPGSWLETPFGSVGMLA